MKSGAQKNLTQKYTPRRIKTKAVCAKDSKAWSGCWDNKKVNLAILGKQKLGLVL